MLVEIGDSSHKGRTVPIKPEHNPAKISARGRKNGERGQDCPSDELDNKRMNHPALTFWPAGFAIAGCFILHSPCRSLPAEPHLLLDAISLFLGDLKELLHFTQRMLNGMERAASRISKLPLHTKPHIVIEIPCMPREPIQLVLQGRAIHCSVTARQAP